MRHEKRKNRTKVMTKAEFDFWTDKECWPRETVQEVVEAEVTAINLTTGTIRISCRSYVSPKEKMSRDIDISEEFMEEIRKGLKELFSSCILTDKRS